MSGEYARLLQLDIYVSMWPYVLGFSGFLTLAFRVSRRGRSESQRCFSSCQGDTEEHLQATVLCGNMVGQRRQVTHRRSCTSERSHFASGSP